MTTTITTMHSLEEIGPNEEYGIEFELEWHLYPAEPMVMYDRDGGGYPGYPAHGEPGSVKIIAIWGLDKHWTARHPAYNNKPDYLPGEAFEPSPELMAQLKDAAERDVDTDMAKYVEEAFEAANDEAEGQKDAAADAAYERMRLGE